MKSRMRLPLLIGLSALLYTCNHIWRFDWGVTEQIRLFCMGIAYALAAWRFQSLWAAFGLHLGWNAAGAVIPADFVQADIFRLAVAFAHLMVAAILSAGLVRRVAPVQIGTE